jgi:hypothetical protein
LREQTLDQCLKVISTKKTSGTSIIEYTTLKRTYTTTKETSTGMSTESVTIRTLKIDTCIWAQCMCVLLTPDAEGVSNRDVYDRYYNSKLKKEKEKEKAYKETKRPI